MRMLSKSLIACAVSILAPALAFGQPQAPPRPGVEGDRIPAHVLARLLQGHAPPSPELDREAAGLSAGRHPEMLTWERVYALALTRTRGGAGVRAEVLDPKALAERAARDGVADFGRFRKEFLAARRGDGGFHDPAGDFLALLDRVEDVENARRNTAFYEHFFALLSELARGESAGVSPVQVKQVEVSMVLARQSLAEAVDDYRNHLEIFRVAVGLSVRAPVLPDRAIVAAFGRVFEQARSWQERPDRDPRELDRIVKGLPALGEVVVEGRSLLALMGGGADQQDEAMTHAVRVAIRNRSEPDNGKAAGDSARLELDIRLRIRRLVALRREYESQQRNYEVSLRLIDQGLEQAGSPPVSNPLARAVATVTALTRLLAPEMQRSRAEGRLVTIWSSFKAERLALYRELSVLPYDDWKSFFDDLSAR